MPQYYRQVRGVCLAAGPQIVSSAPGFLTMLLPKCPMCWAALLAGAGISSAITASLLIPAAILCVTPAIILLTWQARAHKSWRPLALYLAAAALVVTGNLLVPSVWLLSVGAVAMMVAMAWSYSRRAAARKCRCE